MNWKSKIEYLIDKSIPYALVLLVILIIIEFFFKELAEHYIFYIEIFHNLILLIFIIDLIFKYLRIRKFKKFLRESWLDIIAVFPFYLIFRIFEEVIILARIGEEAPKWQGVVHIGKESELIAKEIEEAGKIERLERFARLRRFLRPILRTPRLIKAFVFYEKPKKR
ncbi:MAG: ion transporter [Nanoarchaeota archaeon]|nr:ion transporter [Nanoarchaeota archaeon]